MSSGTSVRAVKPGTKVLIADALNERGAAIIQAGGLAADTRPGLTEDQLCEIIGEYDGLIVRSATKVTGRIIAAGKKLQVIGRAGVGVDNIDVGAATEAGIIVQNTPLGNITSAAEHAVALLFATARNVARADREMKAGKWNKKGLTGVELTGKTLGVIGLGKVGGIVVKVGQALDMTVLVYDPYVTDKKAEELGVRKCDLDTLLRESDFVSIHTPLTPETKNLIGKEKLKLMKKSARLVNAARGGIVSEEALYDALNEGLIAGAGVDVFEKEPLTADARLRTLDNAVLTPHLGASTTEAQERVAEDIARQFVEFFRDGVIRNAVNLPVSPDSKLAPYAKLAEMLGSMAAQMARDPVSRLKVGTYGKLAAGDTRELNLCALKGLLSRSSGHVVTLVNAPGMAEARGIELAEHKSDQVRTYANLIVVTAETAAASGEKKECVVAGTCFDGQAARIVKIGDFDIDLKPAPLILLMFYPDRPGMVGKIGTILGEAEINIANMAVGRREKRGQAAVALTLDDPAPPDVLERLRKAVGVDDLFAIQLS
ncbi:MAG: phosphoglycerate dehydrogenase [Planctomycetota bacterium]|nr:phosphoglycerate dehydrogenase [Planctomycetota bacterium]